MFLNGIQTFMNSSIWCSLQSLHVILIASGHGTNFLLIKVLQSCTWSARWGLGRMMEGTGSLGARDVGEGLCAHMKGEEKLVRARILGLCGTRMGLGVRGMEASSRGMCARG